MGRSVMARSCLMNGTPIVRLGTKCPSHHIDMDDIGPCFFEHADIALHIHEVR